MIKQIACYYAGPPPKATSAPPTTVRRRSRTSAAEVVDILLSSTSDADFDAFLARTAAGPRPGDRDESSQTPTPSPRFESSPAADTAASRMGKLQGEQRCADCRLQKRVSFNVIAEDLTDIDCLYDKFLSIDDLDKYEDVPFLPNGMPFEEFNEPLRCNPARSRESTRTMSKERQARSTLRPTTRRQTARSAHSCATVFEGEEGNNYSRTDSTP